VTFQNNICIGQCSGATFFPGPFTNWTVQNITILGNTFLASTNYFSSSRGGVQLQTRETNQPWNNIIISGNHFGFSTPYAGTQIDINQGVFNFFNTSNIFGMINGVTIANNQVDRNFPLSITNTTGLNMVGNYDQYGNPFYNLPDMQARLAQERQLNNLQRGLVIYAPFNEGLGTNIFDWSPVYRNPNYAAPASTMSITGGKMLWTTGPFASPVFGNSYGLSMTNSAISPDTQSTYTNCLNSSLLSGATFSNLTVYTWFKQPATAAGWASPFFMFRNGGGPALSLGIQSGGV
jgi:hypothetical protein